MPPLLVDEDPDQTVSMTWCIDEDGTVRHNPSGLQVSPDRGVEVDGRAYRLDPRDIQMEREGMLGSGSCGIVERGVHTPSGMHVAVKTVKADNRSKRDQLLHELMGLIQAAGCPYLVQWYAGFVARDTGLVKVVMEFMDRGSLADLRRRLGDAHLEAGHLACVAAQITRGLHHLQTRRMLHRDVKPENVLHTSAGCVKLTDFGISRDLNSTMGVAGTFVGTANYMSPERANGKDYSYRSDIWSAGMVIYELATGQYPFNTKNFMDLYNCLCVDPEPRLDESLFPPGLCDFVAQCLTREEERRPDAQTLLEHEVVSGLCDEQIAAFAAMLATLPD
mmetsp:Transcript_63182/g.124439  ORF Transcript_63182/g.124439 Transcript_63182/m.124439 type:complete len:334 (-) Transcript_63182:75-1076(-)